MGAVSGSNQRRSASTTAAPGFVGSDSSHNSNSNTGSSGQTTDSASGSSSSRDAPEPSGKTAAASKPAGNLSGPSSHAARSQQAAQIRSDARLARQLAQKLREEELRKALQRPPRGPPRDRSANNGEAPKPCETKQPRASGKGPAKQRGSDYKFDEKDAQAEDDRELELEAEDGDDSAHDSEPDDFSGDDEDLADDEVASSRQRSKPKHAAPKQRRREKNGKPDLDGAPDTVEGRYSRDVRCALGLSVRKAGPWKDVTLTYVNNVRFGCSVSDLQAAVRDHLKDDKAVVWDDKLLEMFEDVTGTAKVVLNNDTLRAAWTRAIERECSKAKKKVSVTLRC